MSEESGGMEETLEYKAGYAKAYAEAWGQVNNPNGSFVSFVQRKYLESAKALREASDERSV